MRKFIAIALALIIVLSLIAPAAMAATEATVPVAIDDTAEVLAQTQMTLFIAIGVIVVLAAATIALIIIKKNALKDEH